MVAKDEILPSAQNNCSHKFLAPDAGNILYGTFAAT